MVNWEHLSAIGPATRRHAVAQFWNFHFLSSNQAAGLILEGVLCKGSGEQPAVEAISAAPAKDFLTVQRCQETPNKFDINHCFLT
jgi:hypothetical protein